MCNNKNKRMKNFNEASFVICLETGEWKTMTDVELRESAERLSELVTQELEGKEGYAERRDFLRDARNRLKFTQSLEIIDGVASGMWRR